MPTADPILPPAVTRRLVGVVPANLQMDTSWTAIRTARDTARQAAQGYSPSLMLAWCITRTMEKHPAFRGTVQENGNIAEFVGNRNDWIYAMGNYGDEVQKFAKSNKLDFDEKKDLTRIVDYYNSFYNK